MKLLHYEPFIFAEAILQSATADKINTFKQLPPGWHFGEGGPIDPETVRRALGLAREITSLGFVTDAFPGVSGEVAISASARDRSFEVIVEPDATYTFIRDDDGREVERREGISVIDLKGMLTARRSGEIWSSFAYYTQGTSTGKKDDSTASPSRMRQEAVYPWSPHNAWWTEMRTFATTAVNSMAA